MGGRGEKLGEEERVERPRECFGDMSCRRAAERGID